MMIARKQQHAEEMDRFNAKAKGASHDVTQYISQELRSSVAMSLLAGNPQRVAAMHGDTKYEAKSFNGDILVPLLKATAIQIVREDAPVAVQQRVEQAIEKCKDEASLWLIIAKLYAQSPERLFAEVCWSILVQYESKLLLQL